jgi:hypothetical protein
MKTIPLLGKEGSGVVGGRRGNHHPLPLLPLRREVIFRAEPELERAATPTE